MTTELILPERKHQLATAVHDDLKRLDPLLNPSIRQHDALRQQFWASVIVEVNGLKPDTEKASVLIAVANLCQVGLTFGKTLGHAYLVPFKGKATLVVGYKGFLKLAYSSGYLDSLTTDVVLKGESCKVWVDENGRHILHEPPIDREEPTPDNTVAAYCVYRTKSGNTGVSVTRGSDIRKLNDEAIEKARRWGSRSVWQDHFAAMAMKCPIRREASRWDLSPELARAVHLDEQADRDEDQTCDELEPPRLSEADGLRATLMATLRDKVGCKSESDISSVRSWLRVIDSDGPSYVLQTLTEASNVYGWENILSEATKRI